MCRAVLLFLQSRLILIFFHYIVIGTGLYPSKVSKYFFVKNFSHKTQFFDRYLTFGMYLGLFCGWEISNDFSISFHDEQCHIGVLVDKTIKSMQTKYWFPGMTPFVRKYVNLVCQSVRVFWSWDIILPSFMTSKTMVKNSKLRMSFEAIILTILSSVMQTLLS